LLLLPSCSRCKNYLVEYVQTLEPHLSEDHLLGLLKQLKKVWHETGRNNLLNFHTSCMLVSIGLLQLVESTLFVPASQMNLERLFSIAGGFATKGRSRLGPSLLDAIVRLRVLGKDDVLGLYFTGLNGADEDVEVHDGEFVDTVPVFSTGCQSFLKEILR